MKRVWRFIVFWRYLLMACVVLVGAGPYLFVGSPHPIAPLPSPAPVQVEPISQLSPLRVRYDKIECAMTEFQVLEILGQPQSRVELDVMDSKVMQWREGQESVTIWFVSGQPATVLKKDFSTGSEQVAHQRMP